MSKIKSLIFVGYFEDIFDAIKKYDNYYKILILEENFECNFNKLQLYFNEIVQVKNVHDKESMNRVLENILKKREVGAIYATNEGVVEVCGYLRENNKIEGMNEYQSKCVRDKFLMKQILAKSDIRMANVSKISKVSDFLDFISKNQYPIVIKPQDGSGSQNTYIIKNKNDLDKLVSEINIYDNNFIVESFVKGEEYHCDSIVVDGEVIFSTVGKYVFNLVDTICSDKPVASIIYPSQSNNDGIIQKIKSLNKQVVEALNIKNSICHLEAFETTDGEVIFGEIAARIGGGSLIGKSIKYCHNMDIYEAFVDIGVHNFTLPKLDLGNKFVGFMAFPTNEGKILEIAKEEDYSHIEGLKEVVILNKIGDYIDGKYNTTKRTGYIIIEDTNCNNLRNKILQLYKDFKLETKKSSFSIGSIYG